MRRQLAQLRPSGTSAESLFSPDNQYPYTIDLILAINNSGSAVDITIYHDADGTTYSDATCICSTFALQSGETFEYAPEHGISDYQSAGNVGVQVGTGSTVTFTAYGTVEGEEV